MSEEKSNVGFFDEEEEITLSENELNNILNNSTIELEEAVEDLEKIDSDMRGSENSSEDNLVIMNGSELEQEYLSKITQVENPLKDFKLVQDGKIQEEAQTVSEKSDVEMKSSETILIEEEPVMEEKIEEIEMDVEEPVIEESHIEGEEEIASSLNENEEEIQIEAEEETPKIEEMKTDEDLVIEEISDDEIILDETPSEGFEEEITLEGDEIQEPEETQDLVIEEDVHEIAFDEPEIQAEEIIEEKAVLKDEGAVEEPPMLQDTEELIIEEGVEEMLIPEQTNLDAVQQEAQIVEEKKGAIPDQFFKEDTQTAGIQINEPINETVISSETETQADMGIKEENAANVEPENVKNVLLYLDSLFAYLPEEKIREFAKSKYYDMYNKIFDDMGL